MSFIVYVPPSAGGGERDRTAGLRLAKPALSQLSYTPRRESPAKAFQSPSFSCLRLIKLVGLDGIEPSTSRLSGVRSNQLSYRPFKRNGAYAL